jgi:hypothetical protein
MNTSQLGALILHHYSLHIGRLGRVELFLIAVRRLRRWPAVKLRSLGKMHHPPSAACAKYACGGALSSAAECCCKPGRCVPLAGSTPGNTHSYVFPEAHPQEGWLWKLALACSAHFAFFKIRLWLCPLSALVAFWEPILTFKFRVI